MLRDHNINSVLGNHDLNFLKRNSKIPFFIYPQNWNDLSIREKIEHKSVWIYQDEFSTELNDENFLYINNSKEFFIKNNILLSHFLYPDFNGNLIFKNELINKLLPVHFIFMEVNKVKISFVGHLHLENPIVISSKKEKKELKEGEKVFLDTDNKSYVIFCSSINSYSNNKSKFISYCDKSKILQNHFVEIIEA